MSTQGEVAIVAQVNVNEPAKQKKWYLPLTREEHISYATYEEAQRRADRICPILGVPAVTPISRFE